MTSKEREECLNAVRCIVVGAFTHDLDMFPTECYVIYDILLHCVYSVRF